MNVHKTCGQSALTYPSTCVFLQAQLLLHASSIPTINGYILPTQGTWGFCMILKIISCFIPKHYRLLYFATEKPCVLTQVETDMGYSNTQNSIVEDSSLLECCAESTCTYVLPKRLQIFTSRHIVTSQNTLIYRQWMYKYSNFIIYNVKSAEA